MSIKRNEMRKHVSNFVFMLNCIKKVSIVSLLVLVVTGIVKGILPLVQSFINKEIIDYISIRSSNGFSNEILLLLLIFVFLQCLSFFIVWSENYVSQHVGDKIGNYFRNLIIDKCRKVQYKNYYNSEFYNQLEKASRGVSSSPLHSVQTIVMFFVMASRMLVSLWILSSFNIVVVLILIIFAIPSAYIDSKQRVQSFDLSNKLAPDRRRISYLFGLFYNKNAFKELRINNAEDYIQTKANQAFDKYHATNVKHYKKYGTITLSTTILNIISQGSVYIWLASSVIHGDISLGEFTFYASTAFSFVNLFSNTIQVVSILQHSLNYIDNLKTFLKMDAYNEYDKFQNGINIDEVHTIDFVNVDFSYENNPSFNLRNVNFTVKKGEKIALVGANGAGKTTLLMLLMRYYEPTRGEILVNGINIREIPIKQYRHLFGTIFQDFVMFSLSLRENIALGDLDRMNKDEDIYKVVCRSQLNEIFEPLEKFLDTHIGSDFENGVNLSNGQIQRIALARALFRNSEIMIFDEPTASMDANSEYEIMKKYKELTSRKISFMVSHRLSSTTMADKIIFIKNGEIYEQGDHAKLMADNLEYAKMFRRQAENYFV